MPLLSHQRSTITFTQHVCVSSHHLYIWRNGSNSCLFMNLPFILPTLQPLTRISCCAMNKNGCEHCYSRLRHKVEKLAYWWADIARVLDAVLSGTGRVYAITDISGCRWNHFLRSSGNAKMLNLG